MTRFNDWRDQVFDIIYKTDTKAGKAFDVLLILSILLSVAAVMLDSVERINERHGTWLYSLEWFFTVLFTIEYFVRIWVNPKPFKYIFSFYGLVDLLSVLPTYIALFIPGMNEFLVIRLLRVLRIFRVLKLSTYIHQANFLLSALNSSRQKITVFLFFVVTLATIFGAVLYVIEGPENGFTSIPKSIYWAIVTLTTVGYGDISPHTPAGQAIASVVMILGYSIIAVPTGIFTAELANKMQKEGLTFKRCAGCDKTDHKAIATYCYSCGAKL
ncbi:ion transporter [Litoribacillus peritrichatus]|uniref:Ion transporter n=1 Tax=Litoribacillus peritrichatus TaxID=718191 RepID=A0ABP7MGI9_9GAMM